MQNINLIALLILVAVLILLENTLGDWGMLSGLVIIIIVATFVLRKHSK